MGLIETLSILAGAIFVALFTRGIYVLIYTDFLNNFVEKGLQKHANKLFDKSSVEYKDRDNT
jgi:hypothetical protein